MSPRSELIIKNGNIEKIEEERIDIESKQYNDLLKIYEIAMNQVQTGMLSIKDRLNDMYGYNIIEKVSARIKSKESILNKMKKKDIEFTYPALVDNINDIAGVRIVCPVKEDILFIKEIIQNMPTLKVVEEKNYIESPKKSGYSAYHLIVETPVVIKAETVIIKVEIQIRTVAMDFWSEMEHEIKYKTDKPVAKRESRKLSTYVKSLEKLQRKIVNIYRKQKNDSMYYTAK